MYQIGLANDPQINDEHFDTEFEALVAAKHAATGDLVYAVWCWHSEDDAETLYLIYQGDTWRKA